MKLYEPLNHTPLSGHGYAGAETFGITPYNAPYEPSFITLDEFPQQRFWTWGMFATLEGVGPEVVAELYEQGWEPKTHTTQSAFFILENQFAQTLIVAETGVTVRDWAQAEDIRHAQTYPVFLSYQTQEEEETTFPPTSLTMGMQALISDSTSWHLYMVEQLGDAGSNLLEQIRAGMMLFSPDDQPSAQERRLREQERITRWEPTHAAAQQLAVLYWALHQELTVKAPIRAAQSLPAMNSLHRTRLPALVSFNGLAQSFGPAVQQSIWNQQQTGMLELMTPNGSHLRVIGTNTSESVALHHYVTQMLGPEGLKHLLILLDAYYIQTRGTDRKTDARVSLRQLLIRLGRGNKADDREEQGKLMHTILYLASTYITSDQPASRKEEKPQPLARQKKSSQKSKQQDYSPLLVIERLKPGDDGTLLIPDEVEYHLGYEFFEALFGTQQQFYTVPTAQLLQYHSVRQQQELLLAFYLSNALLAFGGTFSTPFPVLLLQSALQVRENMEQSHDRLRDVSRVLLAIEQLERDELIIRTPHESIDTALAAELVLAEHKTKQEQAGRETVAPSTYTRIQSKLVYMRRQQDTDIRKARRTALQHLLDTRFNTIVEFSPGRLLQEQIHKREVRQEEGKEERNQQLALGKKQEHTKTKQKKPPVKKTKEGERHE